MCIIKYVANELQGILNVFDRLKCGHAAVYVLTRVCRLETPRKNILCEWIIPVAVESHVAHHPGKDAVSACNIEKFTAAFEQPVKQRATRRAGSHISSDDSGVGYSNCIRVRFVQPERPFGVQKHAAVTQVIGHIVLVQEPLRKITAFLCSANGAVSWGCQGQESAATILAAPIFQSDVTACGSENCCAWQMMTVIFIGLLGLTKITYVDTLLKARA